jgi:hypothetical protein
MISEHLAPRSGATSWRACGRERHQPDLSTYPRGEINSSLTIPAASLTIQ